MKKNKGNCKDLSGINYFQENILKIPQQSEFFYEKKNKQIFHIEKIC